jgi:hypothetical protein
MRRIEIIKDFEAVLQGPRRDLEERYNVALAKGAPTGLNADGDQILSMVFGIPGPFRLAFEEMGLEHLEQALSYGGDVRQWAKVIYAGKDSDSWAALTRRSCKAGTVR